MKDIYIATSNPRKAVESGLILEEYGFKLKIAKVNLSESLTVDVDEIIKKKIIDAFSIIKRPVFVEHGGLYIDALDGLPGGLSKPIVFILKNKLCDIIPVSESRNAEASLQIAYCDGMKIHYFQSSIKGKISLKPKGSREYYYDEIFIPDCSDKTFAEMSLEEKNNISHVKAVYGAFGQFLKDKYTP